MEILMKQIVLSIFFIIINSNACRILLNYISRAIINEAFDESISYLWDKKAYAYNSCMNMYARHFHVYIQISE